MCSKAGGLDNGRGGAGAALFPLDYGGLRKPIVTGSVLHVLHSSYLAFSLILRIIFSNS